MVRTVVEGMYKHLLPQVGPQRFLVDEALNGSSEVLPCTVLPLAEVHEISSDGA